MPDLTTFYKMKMKLRRYPQFHRPLKKFRGVFSETIPAKCLEILRALAPADNLRFGPPKSSFSVYNSLFYEKRRPVRVLLTDQGTPELPPDALQIRCQLQQHACQPWPVFWSHHANARLVASSLAMLDDQKRICRESVYGDLCRMDDPAWRYTRLPAPISLKGNWTSLISRWVPTTGVPLFTHWIMDALPRLAMLTEFPGDTQILVPSKLADYQRETLTLLGLLERCRYTPEQHVLVENFYFASPTAMIDCYNPFGVNFLRSQFIPKMDMNYSGPKRFLIHRNNKSRGIQNEAEVYKFFTDLGWTIVDTEKLTFAQEIKLFNDAEAVAGVFGSGFTNAVWCRSGCKLLPFVADSWLDGYVEWIATTLGLEFIYHVFPSDHEMRAYIDLARVKKMLTAAGLYS